MLRKRGTKVDEQIPSRVVHAFGLREPVAHRRLGGTRNANFHVQDEGRSLFLRRRHRDYCDPEWIQFDRDAIRHLKSKGAPVLSPLEIREGGTWIPEGEECWEAYPWIDGNPYPGTTAALDSVANRLAEFHLAGMDFYQSYRPGGFSRGETTPKRLLDIADQLAPACGDIVGFYAKQIEKASRILDEITYESLPQILVHGDVQPANMLFSGSTVLCFVDYDWLGRQPAIYDLAGALILFCGTRTKPIDGGDIWSLSMPFEFELESVRRFLAVYSSGMVLEKESVPLLLEQTRLTWTHIRLSGALKVPEKDRRQFLARDYQRPYAWIDKHCNENLVLD